MSWFFWLTGLEFALGILMILLSQSPSPLDPSWGAYLRDGGAVAAVLFTTSAFCGVLWWVLKTQNEQMTARDAAHAATIEKLTSTHTATVEKLTDRHIKSQERSARLCHGVHRESTMAVLQSAVVMGKVNQTIEGLAGFTRNVKPTDSQKIDAEMLRKQIADLQRAQEDDLKRETKEAALDEDSQDK